MGFGTVGRVGEWLDSNAGVLLVDTCPNIYLLPRF